MRENRVIPADEMHPQRRAMVEALRPLQPRTGALLDAILPIVNEPSIDHLARVEYAPDWSGILDCLREIVRSGAVPPTVHPWLFSSCAFVCSSVYARESIDRYRDEVIMVVLGGALIPVLMERGVTGLWAVDFNAAPVISASIALKHNFPTASARTFATMTEFSRFDDVESLFLAITACVGVLASERMPISISELRVLVHSIREFETSLSAAPDPWLHGPPGQFLENYLAEWSPLLNRYFGNPRPEIPADVAEELKLLALLAA